MVSPFQTSDIIELRVFSWRILDFPHCMTHVFIPLTSTIISPSLHVYRANGLFLPVNNTGAFTVNPLWPGRVKAYLGILLTDGFPFALLPDHMARPLATAHESVKTQTLGLLTVFGSYHCWEDSLPFIPLSWILQSRGHLIGCCPITLELSINHWLLLHSNSQGSVHMAVGSSSSSGGSKVSPRGRVSLIVSPLYLP